MPLNVAHTLFPEASRGLMLCGYEWGHPKADQRDDANLRSGDAETVTTFSTKELADPRALRWRYDLRIQEWFRLWGHALGKDPSARFERSVVQTNWCDTMGNRMSGSIQAKLLDAGSVRNFLLHVNELQPSLIVFFGSQLVKSLNSAAVLGEFSKVMGGVTSPLEFKTKPDGVGFKIAFQSFERCDVVGVPHPSSTRGLTDEYVSSFKKEIGGRIQRYRDARSF